MLFFEIFYYDWGFKLGGMVKTIGVTRNSAINVFVYTHLLLGIEISAAACNVPVASASSDAHLLLAASSSMNSVGTVQSSVYIHPASRPASGMNFICYLHERID